MEDAELVKLVDVGELSRDFGLDITVSDGGLVTSALNQRQYRAECRKIYQEFMLSMADYIFEETQLKKRLQGLLLQKKKPRYGVSEDDDEKASSEKPEGNRDEDAFSPAQMEEFRRLANSRASNRSVSKAGVVGHSDLPQPQTSTSVRAPSRLGVGRAGTPQIFLALRERPLTSSHSTRTAPRKGSAASTIGGTTRRQSGTSSAMMYGGRDQEYDGVMDPTADFSANRRMRMNPRAFSKLTSAGRISVKVLDKKGKFVMKPVVGRPGVVSVSGGDGGGVCQDGVRGEEEGGGEKQQVADSRDKLALVKTATSFNTPTLASELKTNNLVAIQKSLLGKEAKRMTVGEVMAKSRDRRARLFRVQVSTGRLDDWDIPGEQRLRPSTRATSAGARSLERPSRLGMNRRAVDVNPQLRSESPALEAKRGVDCPSLRAKTAPPNRPYVRSSSIPTPRRAPRGDGSLTARSSSQPRSRRGDSQPKLSVVQLELEDSAKVPTPAYPPPPAPKSQPKRGYVVKRQSVSSSCAVFPVSAKSLASERRKTHTVTFSRRMVKPEVTEAAERDCSVQIKHIHTLRDSAAVVRRWKELDRNREDKLNKWRMRMSFAATRRGNLGKVLAKV
ncbi:hypothetical protein ACOMHN_050884 [Nucella lapillus]